MHQITGNERVEVNMKLFITDLDNTLYDWATYFSLSFRAMVEDLTDLLGIEESCILDDFKSIHQFYGNTEQPFAILELPCVKKHFQGLTRFELLEKLNRPLQKFNSMRKRQLKLYPGVENTLKILADAGVLIVGEAMPENAYFRLNMLKISKYFRRLYAVEGKYLGHPDIEREKLLKFPEGFVKMVPRTERKPNPLLLNDICCSEGIAIDAAIYVGDSLTKDILMANEAQIKSVWAKYGTDVNPAHWNILVRVSIGQRMT